MSAQTPTTRRPVPSAAMEPVADERSRLLGVLGKMIGEHAALRALVAQQRDAIAKADTKGIEAVRTRQIERLEVVRGLEAERRRLTRALAGAEDARVEHLAAVYEGADRETLLERARVLRETLAALREEQAVVRESAEQLIGHMQGLMRQIHQKLSHSGTYGRAGRVDAGPSVVSGIDLTS